MSPRGAALVDAAVEFAWSCWVALGAPGTTTRHGEWPVDPEALILLTGSLGPVDARLWDEALDWCIHYQDLTSQIRLRNLHGDWPASRHWPDFAGVVAAHTAKRWPGAAETPPPYERTHSSWLVLRERPAALASVMRQVLGVGASGEILRALLLADGEGLTEQEVARRAGYGMRQVGNTLGDMASVGVVERRQGTDGVRHSLGYRDHFVAIFGPLPTVRIDFPSAARVLTMAADRLGAGEQLPDDVRSVEARALLEAVRADAGRLSLSSPNIPAGRDAWLPTLDWLTPLATAWAAGRAAP